VFAGGHRSTGALGKGGRGTWTDRAKSAKDRGAVILWVKRLLKKMGVIAQEKKVNLITSNQ